uniref:K Homology domain-containing protein n=1 Tax=Cyanoderma ruficeps TaxID=181631 RepID=A0A8C3QVD3_9PASS
PCSGSAAAAAGAAAARGMMAAMLSHAYGGAPALDGEQAALLRRRSVNTTECVPVPSSEHVAEIVGRQGCKIKALRAKTNTYIKTPVRGEEPVFVVTGRREDVAAARREILSAAEHFSLIRASRGRGGPCGAALPGQTTVPVRVPYRVVGLVVGPRGATIKRIQQRTHTYIVTPSRDKEPVFEVTGTPENVDRARREIEMHIAARTGAFPELGDGLRHSGAEPGFEGGPAWPGRRAPRTARASRDGSSSSLGSGSTDSCFGRPADFSPASPFGAAAFWFGEAPPPAEEPPLDPPPSPLLWAPFEPAGPPPGPGAPRRASPSPSEGGERPPGRRHRGGDPPCRGPPPGLPAYAPAFSNGTDSYSSSTGGSASSSPPESRRRHDCLLCSDGEPAAALLPCGHGLCCPRCACGRACPVCRAALSQAAPIRS